MDLTTLESKLNSFSQNNNPFHPFKPTNQMPTISNPFTTPAPPTPSSAKKAPSKPVSVTRKINEVTNEDVQNYSEKQFHLGKIFSRYMRDNGIRKKKSSRHT